MNLPLTARRATMIAKAAVPGVRFRSETRAAGVIRVTLIESLDAGRDLRAAQAAFLQSGYEVGMVLGAGALYVTEAEPVEVEIEEPPARVIHDGDTEPSCRHCRYFTGHTSWCPLAPVVEVTETVEDWGGPAPVLVTRELVEAPEVQPVYSESGVYLGEIRQEETGARYWTAAEIRELREAEAAQRAEVDAYLAGAAHVAARRAALTPAGILAAATGHPSGQVIRSTWTA